MQLSVQQKLEIYENGFTVLPGAIPLLAANNALRAINKSLGEKGMHPDELSTLRAQTYCRELTQETVISDLFHASPLHTLCESALGDDAFLPVRGGQIALRFPMSDSTKARVLQPHLDGMHSPNNGVAQGAFGNFTALVGVFLSDVPEENMGNFSVWPKSHRVFEEYFQQHGPDKFLEGLPPVEIGAPQQITARAGDAVLCHYQLGHGIAPNFSPFIRYAIFFRLEHREHDAHRKEVLADIWRDWPGVRDVIEANAANSDAEENRPRCEINQLRIASAL
jgi:hypothetical protein